MEALNCEGMFWQVDKPELRVAGHLRYRPDEGSALSLIGSLDPDIQQAFSYASQISPRRIVGIADGKYYTLDGSIVRNTRFDGTGLLRQEYYIPIVLEGVHFDPDEELLFSGFTIQLDQLPAWINRSPFQVSMDTPEPNKLNNARKFSISYNVPNILTSKAGDVEIVLSSSFSLGQMLPIEVKMRHAPNLSVRYHDTRQLSDILLDLNGIQDLVSLAVDTPAVPGKIELFHPDVKMADQVRQLPINAYWYNAAEHVRSDELSMTRLIGFDEISGLDGVLRWMGVSRTYRVVVGRLLSIRYSERLPEENRYSNVVGAAETFHRIKYENEIVPATEYKARRRKIVRVIRNAIGPGIADWLNTQLLYSNEPRLRQRLMILASEAGSQFQWLVGDVETWARVVTWMRNRSTHHDPSQDLRRFLPDMGDLTDSVYVLVSLALFRECSFPDHAVAKLENISRFVLLREHLAEVIPRLAEQIRG